MILSAFSRIFYDIAAKLVSFARLAFCLPGMDCGNRIGSQNRIHCALGGMERQNRFGAGFLFKTPPQRNYRTVMVIFAFFLLNVVTVITVFPFFFAFTFPFADMVATDFLLDLYVSL